VLIGCLDWVVDKDVGGRVQLEENKFCFKPDEEGQSRCRFCVTDRGNINERKGDMISPPRELTRRCAAESCEDREQP
jgi:hypothetical protein